MGQLTADIEAPPLYSILRRDPRPICGPFEVSDRRVVEVGEAKPRLADKARDASLLTVTLLDCRD